ncbi:sporulation peptidase YabG [Cohnella zeiphila]|uniref:Sporulation peptidase YabG n=1 Tax=Cohnella zeiphila TaxID=2761120 RepID=A0A7X0SNR6_9BACL|nr:sporulation peptidase YabG [Cohnella zeiphila]MBB6733393.1 sporulation peptidase YabG [Cohnella zeiphila]
MKQGDLVVRKSYGGDVLFRIAGLNDAMALLRGTDYRLLADSRIDDLEPVRNPDELGGTRRARIQAHQSVRRMQEERAHFGSAYASAKGPNRRTYFEMPGKVLHLDGDVHYLRKSMAVYYQLQVPAVGAHCHESQMPSVLAQLLPQVRPDIVVITGHDGVLKHREDWAQLGSYKNSANFVKAVHVARDYEKHFDSMIVVAGACQSHFEALIQAGSNFASAPGRIMIHALDPVYVAVRCALTPFREPIDIADVVAGTISGQQGVGGVETMGRYRIGVPNLQTAIPSGANVM